MVLNNVTHIQGKIKGQADESKTMLGVAQVLISILNKY